MPRALADGKRRVSIGTSAPAGFLTSTPATVDEVDSATLASPYIMASDYNLAQAASDTLDEKALDASGNAKGRGNENYAGGVSVFRYFDSNGASEAVHDDVYDLLLAAAEAGSLVYVYERLTSKASTAAYATGDEIVVVEALVDLPSAPTSTEGYIKRRFELLPQRWRRGTLAAGTASSVPLISSVLPSAAAETEIVTIVGARFTGTTAVTFGGTAATDFNIISDNLLVASMPAGSAGSAVVVVTNAGGASASFAYTRGA